MNVTVRAGDLVLGDARVLHGAHPNASDARRTVLTLWYLPRWHAMSESMRAHAALLHEQQCGQEMGARWPEQDLEQLVAGNLLMPPAAVDGKAGVDEFDHNAGAYMHRTPGHVPHATEDAIQAYQKYGSSVCP